MGGHSKNLPIDLLVEKLSLVNFIVLIKGSFTDEVYNFLKVKYSEKLSPIFDKLDEAIKYSIEKALHLKTENYLLFSPGATSFAMFKNEFDRGDQFNKYAKKS